MRNNGYQRKCKDVYDWLATTRYFNYRVKARQVIVGEMLLRQDKFTNLTTRNKCITNWEGPYIVREIIKPGSYYLESLEVVKLSCPLNVERLNNFNT